MKIEIKHYPISGYVVEMTSNNTTYQLAPEQNQKIAEQNKMSLEAFLKLIKPKQQ